MQPIKTALLSFGLSGRVFHAPFIHAHPGFQLQGIFERSRKTAKELYPQITSYSSFEELLSDPGLELVVVNTPNASHFEYTRRALEAGKHVVVEKPFVPSYDEARVLQQLAEDRGLQLSVFHNRRWDSDFLTVKKVLHSGSLGAVVEASFHFDRYKEELSVKAHKETPGPGAGVLYDLGSHIIDQALHLFGTPASVWADIGILRPLSQVDDYFEIVLYYEGRRVRLHSSYLVREPLPMFVLHGTKGSFIKTRADVQEDRLQAGGMPGDPGWGLEKEGMEGLLHAEVDGKIVRVKIPTEQGDYGRYFEGMYLAIREGHPVPVTAAEGALVIRVIEAAFQSSHQRQVVDL